MRFVLLFLIAIFVAPTLAAAANPDSPKVRALIENGLKYLETNTDDRLGGKCLIGLCFLKETGDTNHPKVLEAVKACQAACRGEPEAIRQDIYSTGIALIFLCETDPSLYQEEITKLVESLRLRQKEGGGWGYQDGVHKATGDTSMTQYAALGLWTAQHAGFELPPEVYARACNWLLRTQDTTGGWGYQGNDPGEGNYERVKQTGVRHSLTAAGLGSLYIMADTLHITAAAQEKDDELPPALKLVVDEKEARKPKSDQVSPRRVQTAFTGGNRWFAGNAQIETNQWQHYFLYALERAQSFRELAEGKTVKEPRWYDQGVELLANTQSEKGSWNSNGGEAVDTAFSVLFLMRSTRKTIEKTVENLAEGTLTGGRGLPGDTSNVRVRGGKVVAAPIVKSMQDLLTLLEDTEENGEAIDPTAALLVDAERPHTQEELERLRLLVSAGNYATRKTAVEVLGSQRRLENAPALIYALSDPDWRVAVAARDALRRLSLKLEGFGLSDHPTPAEVAAAQEKWRAWHKSVQPTEP